MRELDVFHPKKERKNKAFWYILIKQYPDKFDTTGLFGKNTPDNPQTFLQTAQFLWEKYDEIEKVLTNI